MSEKNQQKKHITEHGFFKSAMVLILVVIVVTFVGAPVVGSLGGGTSHSFGSYQGVPIVYQEGNYFHEQVMNLNRQYESVSDMEFKLRLVWRQAFERATIQVALKSLAEKSGIILSENELNESLAQYYVDDQGKPSRQVYENVPAADRMKLASEVRLNLLLSEYYNLAVVKPGVDEATLQFLAAQEYPQRKFSFVVFDTKDYPAKEIVQFGQTNSNLFRSIQLSRITLSGSKEEAEKIRAEALKADRTFDDLAQAYSKDTLATLGGDMGSRLYHELKSEFTDPTNLDAIFALSQGEISTLYAKNDQWVFYKVTQPVLNLDLTQDFAQTSVRSYIESQEKGLIEDHLELLAKGLKTAAESSTFEQAAGALGKTVESSDFMPINFGSLPWYKSVSQASNNATFQTLANNEEFFKKAYSLRVGEISDPILASPALLVVRFDEQKVAPADFKENTELIQNYILQSRGQSLEQGILKSPDFKDDYTKAMAKLYPGLNL